jgi:hypothetical protein
LKSPVKGATHHATKTVQRLKDGGPVTSPGKVEKTERMSDGSQQYVRGATHKNKVDTISRYAQNAIKNMGAASGGSREEFNRQFRASNKIMDAYEPETDAEIARMNREYGDKKRR